MTSELPSPRGRANAVTFRSSPSTLSRVCSAGATARSLPRCQILPAKWASILLGSGATTCVSRSRRSTPEPDPSPARAGRFDRDLLLAVAPAPQPRRRDAIPAARCTGSSAPWHSAGTSSQSTGQVALLRSPARCRSAMRSIVCRTLRQNPCPSFRRPLRSRLAPPLPRSQHPGPIRRCHGRIEHPDAVALDRAVALKDLLLRIPPAPRSVR